GSVFLLQPAFRPLDDGSAIQRGDGVAHRRSHRSALHRPSIPLQGIRRLAVSPLATSATPLGRAGGWRCYNCSTQRVPASPRTEDLLSHLGVMILGLAATAR